MLKNKCTFGFWTNPLTVKWSRDLILNTKTVPHIFSLDFHFIILIRDYCKCVHTPILNILVCVLLCFTMKTNVLSKSKLQLNHNYITQKIGIFCFNELLTNKKKKKWCHEEIHFLKKLSSAGFKSIFFGNEHYHSGANYWSWVCVCVCTAKWKTCNYYLVLRLTTIFLFLPI